MQPIPATPSSYSPLAFAYDAASRPFLGSRVDGEKASHDRPDRLKAPTVLRQALDGFADVTGLRGVLDARHARQVCQDARAMLAQLTQEAVQALRAQGPSANTEVRFCGLAESWGRYHDSSVALCEHRVYGHTVLWWALDKDAEDLLLSLLHLYNDRPEPKGMTSALSEIESLLQSPKWADLYAKAQAQCVAIASHVETHRRQQEVQQSIQTLRDSIVEPAAPTSRHAAHINALLEGECGENVARIAREQGFDRDCSGADLRMAHSLLLPLLRASSDLALNRLLHYRMPSPSGLMPLLESLPRDEATRMLLLYADVLREKGACLDEIRFVPPQQQVTKSLPSADDSASDASRACLDTPSPQPSLVVCEDGTDNWDTQSHSSASQSTCVAPSEVSEATRLPDICLMPAYRALSASTRTRNLPSWPPTVNLRDVARRLELDEAALWFDTDGQAPAHIRLERYSKPLLDLGPL